MNHAPPSTLLLILGAGASYDSLPASVLNGISPNERKELQPPLARDLFADRHSFGEVLDRFPQCAALIGDLRRKLEKGAVVEAELEALREEAASYPPRHRELAAVRFYLQAVLWKCGTRWRDLSHGVTNYADLLRRIDKWRHEAQSVVCVASLNYDLLFDDAASGTLRMNLNSIPGFVADERYKYVKLHGSVNWGRRVPSPDGAHHPNGDDARRLLIDNAQTLAEMQDQWVLRSPGEAPSDSGPPTILFPAIAIPTATKSDFVCPDWHVEALRNCLPRVDRILVVGWRGADRDLLDLLGAIPGKATPVLVVGAREDGTRETVANLASTDLAEDVMMRFTGGFSGFLETEELESFLTSSVANLRARYSSLHGSA